MKGKAKAQLLLCLAYTRKIVLRTGGIAPRILILVNMQVGCQFHAPDHFTLPPTHLIADSAYLQQPRRTQWLGKIPPALLGIETAFSGRQAHSSVIILIHTGSFDIA